MPSCRPKFRAPIVSIAATLILAAGAGASSAHADPGEDFAITDRNSDGFVDRGEFHQRMVELFFFADADQDGRLVPAELPRVPPGVFGNADRNGDGALSLAEFTEARAIDFGQADVNRDGLLSRVEVNAVSRPAAAAAPKPADR
jgi:Ca2+-binding EF-hand superfamily protein